MLLIRWFGCACGGLEVKRAGADAAMHLFECACGGPEVKRAGADAADALVWVCLWGPGGEKRAGWGVLVGAWR